MFGLPIEALSMLLSTALGGLMKMWGQSQADKAEQHKIMLGFNKQVEEEVNNARQLQNPNAAWIRRFIVVAALLAGVGIIFIAPLTGNVTNVPLEVTSGFKLLFLDFTNTAVEYVQLTGFVTPEWLPLAVTNIIGFYFGAAAVKR